VTLVVYLIEWSDSDGRPLGCEDYSFAPGEGRVRHATVGPPGRLPLSGYPHAARTVDRLMVAVPSEWALDNPDHPTWLVNRGNGRAERLEAACVYLRAARGSVGFALAGRPVPAG
jgi:hypothetical protein